MLTNYFPIALISFFCGMFFLLLARGFSLRNKILVSQGIPLIGGISIGLAFLSIALFSLSFSRNLSKELLGILLSSFIILAAGIVDDLRELNIQRKFLLQIIAAFVLLTFGVKTQIVYIGGLANIAITFVWVLAITNAFNHLDVMDGVAAGVAFVSSAAFFFTAIFCADFGIAVLSLVLTGATAGFLLYNLPPAKVYLGNSGSHFLGFVLAAISLAMSYAPLERKIALLSPLLILGFPIFDTAFVILMRLAKKRSPFKKSNDHLALRFLKSGYSKKTTLSCILLLAVFFSFSGIALSRVSNVLGAAIIALIILVCFALTRKMGKVVMDG